MNPKEAMAQITEGLALPASSYLELLAGTCAAWFFQLTENEEDTHVDD